MPRLALALCFVFFASLFVFRSVVQFRKTGSTGVKGFSGRIGSLPWLAGVTASLGLVLAPVAPLAAIYGWPGGGLILSNAAAHYIGAAFAVAGIGGALLAQLSMGNSWRVGVDESEVTDLVTSGLFAWVRNPIFTFIWTSLLGLVLLVPNGAALLASRRGGASRGRDGSAGAGISDRAALFGHACEAVDLETDTLAAWGFGGGSLCQIHDAVDRNESGHCDCTRCVGRSFQGAISFEFRLCEIRPDWRGQPSSSIGSRTNGAPKDDPPRGIFTRMKARRARKGAGELQRRSSALATSQNASISSRELSSGRLPML